MDSGLMVTLSIALTHGAAIALGLRELWLLRAPSGGTGKRDPLPAPTPPLAGDGLPRPLPDCLIPKPLPALRDRVRELEPA